MISRPMEPVTLCDGCESCGTCLLAPTETPLAHLLVPAGFARLRRVEAHRMIRFVKRSIVAGTRMLSVCSGAFNLHAAGVLTIERTTNWKAIDALRKIE